MSESISCWLFLVMWKSLVVYIYPCYQYMLHSNFMTERVPLVIPQSIYSYIFIFLKDQRHSQDHLKRNWFMPAKKGRNWQDHTFFFLSPEEYLSYFIQWYLIRQVAEIFAMSKSSLIIKSSTSFSFFLISLLIGSSINVISLKMKGIFGRGNL